MSELNGSFSVGCYAGVFGQDQGNANSRVSWRGVFYGKAGFFIMSLNSF